MPVKAIQNMLGEETDVWNMHRPIDWDFVNSNYRAAVIGGAGLLAKVFNKFWVDCAANCKIPIIVWGLGTCIVDGLPLEDTTCDIEPVRSIFERALMVNVRDELTADLYGGKIRDGISITACPTIYYLRDFEVVAEPKTVTLSVHPDLVNDETHDAIEALCVSEGFYGVANAKCAIGRARSRRHHSRLLLPKRTGYCDPTSRRDHRIWAWHSLPRHAWRPKGSRIPSTIWRWQVV
jgi:hypothetical protein